jgi:hypothetical protein
MNTDSLKGLIASYLEGAVTSSLFQERVIQEFWDATPDEDPDLWGMLADIELRFAEYTSDHLSDDELRDALKAILYGLSSVGYSQALVESPGGTKFVVRTSTGSQAEHDSPSLSLEWAGTGYAKVSV